MTPLSLDPTIRTLCYYLALKITLITLMMNKQHKIYIYRYIFIYLFIYLSFWECLYLYFVFKVFLEVLSSCGTTEF